MALSELSRLKALNVQSNKSKNVVEPKEEPKETREPKECKEEIGFSINYETLQEESSKKSKSKKVYE